MRELSVRDKAVLMMVKTALNPSIKGQEANEKENALAKRHH